MIAVPQGGKTVPALIPKGSVCLYVLGDGCRCLGIFAGITSIFGQVRPFETDSDVATALRTLVVLVFAWIMVSVVGSAILSPR